MTHEQRAWALDQIGILFAEGSPSNRRIAAHLGQVLLTNPDNFVDEFFLYTQMDDLARRQAERLLRNGSITEGTTFAELPAIITADHAEQKARSAKKQ